MRLDYLKTFLVVAEKKSFTKAARLLFLSQTAVSFQIRSLEEYYGEKFFERLHNSVVLTDAGRILQQSASEIINLEQETKKALDSAKDVVQGQCIVGASFAIARTLLLRVLNPLRDRLPNINFHLHVHCCARVIQGLLDGGIDIGIVASYMINKNLEPYPLFTDRMGLVASPKFPFIGRDGDDPIELEKVLKMPFIIGESGCCARMKLENLLNDVGLSMKDLKVIMTVNSFDELKSALKQGIAASIIPLQHVDEEIDRKELIAREINGFTSPISFVAVFNKQKPLRKCAQALLELIKTESIISQSNSKS